MFSNDAPEVCAWILVLNLTPIFVDPGNEVWIGAHAVILPGIKLGCYTIVGAGAVVTKSFEKGYQVLAGNPARVIRVLNPAECVLHRSAEEFHGFIAVADFPAFRRRHLKPLT